MFLWPVAPVHQMDAEVRVLLRKGTSRALVLARVVVSAGSSGTRLRWRAASCKMETGLESSEQTHSSAALPEPLLEEPLLSEVDPIPHLLGGAGTCLRARLHVPSAASVGIFTLLPV